MHVAVASIVIVMSTMVIVNDAHLWGGSKSLEIFGVDRTRPITRENAGFGYSPPTAGILPDSAVYGFIPPPRNGVETA